MDEILDHLRRGEFPEKGPLSNFPFGQDLISLVESDHSEHVKLVVKKMSEMLSVAPVKIIAEAPTIENADDFNTFTRVMQKVKEIITTIFVDQKYSKDDVNDFLLLAALFHDIGKIIQRDRHALEGYHFLKNVNPKELEKLKKMLGEYRTELLCHTIKFHDLFGVISTGEGSLLVLNDALKCHNINVENQKLLFSLLFVLNLADISGVIDLTADIAARISKDWEIICNILDQTNGDKQKYTNTLIKFEQNSSRAVDRIYRLLISTCPKGKSHLFTHDKIGELLLIATGNQFYDFWNDFPLVCKFDYALRFFKKFQAYAFANNNDSITDKVIEIMILLIKDLMQSYTILTKRPDKSRRRIGIEVMGWTRTEKIAESLIILLFDDVTKGLSWAREEATAWYLD